MVDAPESDHLVDPTLFNISIIYIGIPSILFAFGESQLRSKGVYGVRTIQFIHRDLPPTPSQLYKNEILRGVIGSEGRNLRIFTRAWWMGLAQRDLVSLVK
ncbi:hypothetical protein QVD99_003356 [Batrachochytrium dendrobatidis]|nr:hypothetical protein QVD99_003356 [Batrachochytrium dendrobatidis]